MILNSVFSAAMKPLSELMNEEAHVRKLEGIVTGVVNDGRAQLNKRWKGLGWKCMYPGCQNSVIRSHSLQKGGTLSLLAETGKQPNSALIVTPEWSPYSEQDLNRRDISIGDASTFPGFCGAHDGSLFKAFEAPGVILDLETRPSQSYRSFCRELRLHEHQNASNEATRERMREAQRCYMVDLLVSVIPMEHRPSFPGLETWKIRLNAHAGAEFDALLNAQKAFLQLFQPLAGSFERYIADTQQRPAIAARFYTLGRSLPYALSGSADISKVPYSPVPIFYFVMPMGSVTEVGLFTSIEHEQPLDDLLEEKGVSRHSVGTPSTALASLCEQLLLDGTDHWFMRPSAWYGLPETQRNELIPLVWESDRKIWHKRRPTVIFDTDGCTVLRQEYFKAI